MAQALDRREVTADQVLGVVNALRSGELTPSQFQGALAAVKGGDMTPPLVIEYLKGLQEMNALPEESQ